MFEQSTILKLPLNFIFLIKNCKGILVIIFSILLSVSMGIGYKPIQKNTEKYRKKECFIAREKAIVSGLEFINEPIEDKKFDITK